MQTNNISFNGYNNITVLTNIHMDQEVLVNCLNCIIPATQDMPGAELLLVTIINSDQDNPNYCYSATYKVPFDPKNPKYHENLVSNWGDFLNDDEGTLFCTRSWTYDEFTQILQLTAHITC